jgi:hypothetical protein
MSERKWTCPKYLSYSAQFVFRIMRRGNCKKFDGAVAVAPGVIAATKSVAAYKTVKRV